jgi:hypothetical protein
LFSKAVSVFQGSTFQNCRFLPRPLPAALYVRSPYVYRVLSLSFHVATQRCISTDFYNRLSSGTYVYHLMQRRKTLRFADTSFFTMCVFSMTMNTHLSVLFKNVDVVDFMRETVCSVWGSDWIFLYNRFFLFQLNTYIYHQLLPTCFGVCSIIFRQTIALLAKTLYAICNIAKKAYSNDIVYTIYQLFHSYCTDLTIYSTALQVGRSRVRFPMVLLEFFINVILPAALFAWGRLRL